MKKIFYVMMGVFCFGIQANSQTYSTVGGIIPAFGPDAGGAFYNIAVPDEFSVSEVKVRVLCHVLTDGLDSVSVMGNLGVVLFKHGTEMYLCDHQCTSTAFSTIDLTFSDYALDRVNEACEPIGTFQTTSVDRFGEAQTTNLSEFTDSSNGTWQFIITWKPFEGGPPDLSLSIDSLFLIFNSETLGIDVPNTENSLAIFPNPVKNGATLTIHQAGASLYDVNIYDLAGKLTMSSHSNIGTSEVKIPSIQSGIYLVEIVNENGSRLYNKIIIN